MSRTFKGLYPKIYDFDNLWLAWRRGRRGGKRKWPTVAEFEVDLRFQTSEDTVGKLVCHGTSTL